MTESTDANLTGPELALSQVLHHLRGHLGIIIFWALLAALVAAVVTTSLVPRQYLARTTLLVNASAPNALGSTAMDQDALSMLVAGRGTSSVFELIGHAHSVLTSRTVADTIVQRFDLKRHFQVVTDWEARAALAAITAIQDDTKQQKLSISVSIKGTPWITDRSPRADWDRRVMAADIANAYREELKKVDTLLFRAAASTRREFLQQRLDEARLALAEAEDDFRDWQQANQVLAPQAVASEMTKRLVELQLEHEQAMVAAAVATRQLQTAQTQLTSIPRERQASSLEIRNPIIDDLQNRLTQAQTDLALALHVAGNLEKHPEVRRCRAEIASLTAELSQAFADSLVTQERTTSISPAYDEVHKTLLQAHLQKASAASRAAALDTAIDRVSSHIARMPEEQTEYVRRSRAVSVKEQVHQMLRMEYEQALIDEHRAVDSFLVLDPAIPPEQKSSPHMLTSIVVAFAAGLLFAALWSLFILGAGQGRKL